MNINKKITIPYNCARKTLQTNETTMIFSTLSSRLSAFSAFALKTSCSLFAARSLKLKDTQSVNELKYNFQINTYRGAFNAHWASFTDRSTLSSGAWRSRLSRRSLKMENNRNKEIF